MRFDSEAVDGLLDAWWKIGFVSLSASKSKNQEEM